jgi:hypothetical protein
MEASRSLALKQAFEDDRSKVKKIMTQFFHFKQGRFAYSKYYKEDEDSRILTRLYARMELCYCGEIYEAEDKNHYRSKHHVKYDMDNEYCHECKSHELRYEHPCFNPTCVCGEKYHILSVYYNESLFHELHTFYSRKHHYYILFGPDF